MFLSVFLQNEAYWLVDFRRFAEEAPEILKHLVSTWLLTLLTLFNNSHADEAEGEILSMDDPVKRNTILRH